MKKNLTLMTLLVQGLLTNNLNAATQLTASLVVSASTAGQFVPAANGGAPNATKATFKFVATGGAAVIAEVKFVATGTEAAITSVGTAGGLAPVVNGIAHLAGLNLALPNGGGGLDQDFFVSYSEVGPNGLPSGSTAGITLTYVKYVSRETATVSALNTNIPAPTMKLVGSCPTISVTPSGATLTAGLVDVGHITVAADAKGDLTVNQIPVKVVLSDGIVAFIIYRANNIISVKDSNNNPLTTTNPAFFSQKTGDTSVITFTGGYQIPAGTKQTFKIFLPFDSVKFSPTDGSPPQVFLGLGDSNLFGWTDVAGNTSFTAENGIFFYNYPVNIVGIVGNGTVTKPPRLEINKVPTGSFVLSIIGSPNQWYRLESTTDFLLWETVGKFQSSSGNTGYDLGANIIGRKFFRAIYSP